MKLIELPLHSAVGRFFDESEKNGLERREGQIEMSREITQAIIDVRSLVVEAEVGIGKSLAYLVPLVLQFFRERRQIIIATSTISLQEQLERDIKTVLEMIGVKTRIEVAKGMKNYICLKRLCSLSNEGKEFNNLFEVAKHGVQDKSKMNVLDKLWDKICIGSFGERCADCSFRRRCEYLQMRERLRTHDEIVICNQNMLVSHLVNQESGNGIFKPDLSTIVVDEAHNLEGKFRDAFTTSFNCNEMRSEILGVTANKKKELSSVIAEIITMLDTLFKYLHHDMYRQKKESDGDMRTFYYRPNKEIKRLLLQIRSDMAEIERRTNRKLRSLQMLRDSESKNYLVWLTNENGIKINVCKKDISKDIGRLLFVNGRRTILTSATISDKDREKIPVYTYSQLSDYSAWSTEKPKESADKVIEERVVYRYVPSDTNTTENTEGEMRTITGTVDPVFAGKQAILFVYKIDEAADYTNEAVAQTIIGENGEYSFEFKLREEPTSISENGEKKPTGDFTVTLGIEGTSSVIYLNPIKAPTPEYTVEYIDYDGTVLLSTNVKDGEAAPIPEKIPERKGYTFAGWNNDPSEIHSNVTMTAIYTKNVYTVAFVDWSNESVVLQQYKYGDPILPPEVNVPDGMVFKGWDILLDETSVVTENLVAVAIYKPKQLEVNFVDYDGNVISTQTVEYGKTAVLPDALDDLTDRAFICWSISQNAPITEDLVVEPVVNYFETAETPNVSLESDTYDTEQTIEITTSDKSKIYYTLDGSDPSENGLEYNGTIKITKSCVLKCIAKDNNKNNSAVVTRYYAINSGEALTDYMDYSLLPDYVRNNAADYKVISTKGYRYMMKNSVNFKSEYDNLLKSGWTVKSESWSEWSEWTTSLNGTSDMIIEQNSKDAEPVDVPFYQYSHYKYYDESSKSYQYSATELEGVECTYESIESADKLTISAFVDGVSTYTLNGRTWFNQKSIMKSVIPSDKLYQYRYKIMVMTKMSDWVEKLPDGAEAVEEGEVFCYVEPARYIVEIKTADGAPLYKNLEIANKTIAIDASVLEREGFIVTGLVDEDGNTWDIDKDEVTKNTVLTVNYKPVTYTVTFKALDGTVVKECTVDCFMNAVPPIMESNDENVFVGWDSDKYLSVTEDMVITAKYLPADEMPTLKPTRDSYYMYPGNTRVLSALTFNIDKETETIIWTSMNPKIATVTDDGRLEAISEGETDIVISEFSSGLMAICTVNVAADPSSVIDDNPPITTTDNAPSGTTTTTTVNPDPTTTDNHIASDEELCEWAENDYQNKNGLTFTNSFVKETEDGDYQIIITDKSGKVLDTYTIDPETGKGVNSEGEEVDLPQTGNNSLRKLLIILSSLMLIGIGMVAIYTSGIIRRKKNEE